MSTDGDATRAGRERLRMDTGMPAPEIVATTRAGRRKLDLDLGRALEGLVEEDDSVLVLDDAVWERVVAVTGGAAAPCFQCGVCTATCPWGLVRPEPMVIRRLLREAQLGAPGWAEALWLCTSCGLCAARCPRGVDIPGVIRSLRTLAWKEGRAPSGLPTLLWNVYWDGNPYGRPPSQRGAWMEGSGLRPFAPGDEVLLYVGCTGNYDRRIQKVVRALARVFESAGVAFGVLGDDEPCCGDAPASVGQLEYAEHLAARAIALFVERGARTVVTVSPHCLEQFTRAIRSGDSVRALHYTAYLRELADAGRLNLGGGLAARVTFHDPCALGRRNGDYESPRRVLAAVPEIELVEMAHTREDALCCGGGGGRMWMDTPASQRFATLRIAEARETGAGVIATACPHCISCLEDALPADGSLRVADIAEIVAWAMAKPDAVAAGGTT